VLAPCVCEQHDSHPVGRLGLGMNVALGHRPKLAGR
jgi:hypothetical protein